MGFFIDKGEKLAENQRGMENNKPKYFDDNGAGINPDLISKSSLCITCKKNILSGDLSPLQYN